MVKEFKSKYEEEGLDRDEALLNEHEQKVKGLLEEYPQYSQY